MITRLKNDDICIGTRGGGVIVYDPQMKTQKKKLHFNSNIYAIAEDNEGTVWMGSRGEGLRIGDNGIPTNPGMLHPSAIIISLSYTATRKGECG